jgi:hypothetical protein
VGRDDKFHTRKEVPDGIRVVCKGLRTTYQIDPKEMMLPLVMIDAHEEAAVLYAPVWFSVLTHNEFAIFGGSEGCVLA